MSERLSPFARITDAFPQCQQQGRYGGLVGSLVGLGQHRCLEHDAILDQASRLPGRVRQGRVQRYRCHDSLVAAPLSVQVCVIIQ